MLRLLRRLLFFLHKRTESRERKPKRHKGNNNLKSMTGIVTTVCNDYGWINESIFFTTDVVTGNEPVISGRNAIALVEEDEISHIMKAIKVKLISEAVDGVNPSEPERRLCIKYVTSVTDDAVYFSEDTSFSLQLISGGFVPFRGDLLQLEYSIRPGTSNINIHTMSALNTQRVEEACITCLEGRNGMVESNIFFTLDSLDVPFGYTPRMHDIVNVVVVDCVRLTFSLRAISMTPV